MNSNALILIITTLLCLQHIPSTISNTKNVPTDFSKLKSWVNDNINEFNRRRKKISAGIPNSKIVLDHKLAKAEDGVRVLTVAKGGAGQFDSITEAIENIPKDNKNRTIIWIRGGEYWEKILIRCNKRFVTLYGDPNDMPKIVFNAMAAQCSTYYSATVAVESDYFMAVNVAFVNAAPMPDVNRTGQQAVALRISGDKAAFHNCKFVGFQDTLCDDKGRHFFKDCYITGTVDFIFGNGKSLYLNTTIESVANGSGVITAQARENENEESGFAFVYCNVSGMSNNTYLGRAWKKRPRVVFAYTYMGPTVHSEGWSTGKFPDRNETVFYGEYKCRGPGASSTQRVKYAKLLTFEEAKPFLSMTYINGNKWLIPPPEL